MNTTETLTQLITEIDASTGRRALLESYYEGRQALAFISPEARIAIGNRFQRINSNICRLAVTALSERLRITGFIVDGGPDPTLWRDWTRCDLDQLAGVAHREALTLGESYVAVWADRSGAPTITVESASQVAVRRDPATREVIAAVKRWETPTSTEATLFLPDKITRFTSPTIGATTGFRAVSSVPNPFGMVPVIPLRNGDRLVGSHSELDDLIPLVDALSKMLADMLVSSEYAGRPRRWATGLELVEEGDPDPETGEALTINPIDDSLRMMVSESPETKFGQLEAAQLDGYEAAVRVLVSQIMAVSALPSHYIGVLANQPSSADALRAAEASLTARAEARQQSFGEAWERVARLMVAIRSSQDPRALDVRVQWADAATRSIAQEADATVKLFASGLLPRSYALRRLGYSDDEIAAVQAAAQADAPTPNHPTR